MGLQIGIVKSMISNAGDFEPATNINFDLTSSVLDCGFLKSKRMHGEQCCD